LTLTSGEQLISGGVARPTAAAIDGLDSNYTAYWYGPWLGTDIVYQLNQTLTIGGGFEYHWINYFAQADWNLRSDFEHPVSFEHAATGSGIVWDINGTYQLNSEWQLTMNVLLQRWKAEDGSDRTFFTDGSVGKTRLNQVNWSSYALMTGLLYHF